MTTEVAESQKKGSTTSRPTQQKGSVKDIQKQAESRARRKMKAAERERRRKIAPNLKDYGDRTVVMHCALRNDNKLYDVLEIVVNLKTKDIESITLIYENHDKYSAIMQLENTVVHDSLYNTG